MFWVGCEEGRDISHRIFRRRGGKNKEMTLGGSDALHQDRCVSGSEIQGYYIGCYGEHNLLSGFSSVGAT